MRGLIMIDAELCIPCGHVVCVVGGASVGRGILL